jgi:hypothetical protein
MNLAMAPCICHLRARSSCSSLSRPDSQRDLQV